MKNKKSTFLRLYAFAAIFILFFSFGFTIKSWSQTTETFTSNGTWIVPAGVTTVAVEMWGGGAGGGTDNKGAGGGGGGAYTKKNELNVTPGANITVTVGAGGLRGNAGGASSFLTVTANGGLSTTDITGGAGGAAGASGDVNSAGGSGGNGNNANNSGGGGGGAAGSISGPGASGKSQSEGGTGGTGISPAGSGGNGGTVSPTSPGNGTVIGGGGGGEADGADNAGAGARGEVKITYTIPKTWIGAIDTDWNTDENWNPSGVPGSSENVVIPASLTNYPTLSAPGTCLSLFIDGGSVNVSTYTLTIAGDVTIGSETTLSVTSGSVEVAGNWTNNGTFTPGSGTVEFTASTEVTQAISGNTTFYDLSKPNSNSTLSFGSTETTIAHDLSIGGGTMDGATSTIIFTENGSSLRGSSVKNFHNLQIDYGASVTQTSGTNINIHNSFTNNGTFTQNDSRTITFQTTNQTLAGTGTSTFGNVKVSNVTVNAGTHDFTVLGEFDVTNTSGVFNGDNATVTFSGASASIGNGIGISNFNNVLNNGTLTIPSDANLLAQSVSDNGTTKVSVALGNDDWYLVSSPVSGQNMKAFGDNTNNPIDKYNPGDGETYDIGIHSEPLGKWSYPVPTTGTHSNPFVFGNGYGIRLANETNPDGGTVEFEGNLFSSLPGVLVTTDNFGWNCIGNPFSAPMSVSDFLGSPGSGNIDILASSFKDIYIWLNSAQQYYTATSQNITNLSKCQGFFVKAGSADDIVFTRDMQSITKVDLKSAETKEVWPIITLKARSGDLTDMTWIRFNQNMSLGLDETCDFGKFKGNSNISLYQELLEGVGPDMETQSLPDPGEVTFRIPIGLDLAQGADITFSVQCDSLPENIIVMLEDVQTNIQTQLNLENVNYTVSLEDNTHGFGRFYLLVSKSEVTDLDDISHPTLHVFTQEKTIFIKGEVAPGTEINLYNINGKLLLKKIATQSGQNEIEATGIPAGIYLLNVKSNGSGQTFKTVLK